MNANRIGEININTQGLKMWIKEYISSHNINVEFEDGYISYNKRYSNFIKGMIKNPSFKNVQIIDRTGEENINNQSLKMWINKYRNNRDIDVEFEDGYISYNKYYRNFKLGVIENPNFKNSCIKNRNGETNINTQDLKMTIKEYRRMNDIDVEFEDGYISYNRTYDEFKKGKINNKNFKKPKEIDISFQSRVGEINYNSYGSKMTIVKYTFSDDIIVEFENGYRTKASYGNFLNSSIISPYDKTLYNIGYLGEKEYKTKENYENTKQYKCWHSMLTRCYSENHQEVAPTYKDCTVCSEWLNYQNFAQWYDDNYYEVNNEVMELDKDILHKGNKVYSPENCVFVPHRINTLFVKNDANRGEYPIGVDFHKQSGKFRARCSIYKNNKQKSKSLGIYVTPNEAFCHYKTFKEQYIKEVASEYKDKIPQKLYKAMYNWIVEITD